MSTRARDNNSMATILTFERDSQSEWSTIWSTSNIPGMDNAAGGTRHRAVGRRRLRVGSLVLGALLTMHCRVSSAALTGGFFIFIMFLVLAVVALANPMRHFEVYLGQWSINGPGRAFRIVPLLDGIGIAMCVNTIIRAIISCVIAAMTATYLVHSVRDDKLPFTYCRTFNLTPYDPILKNDTNPALRNTRFSKATYNLENNKNKPSTVGFIDRAWRNSKSYKATRGKTEKTNKKSIITVIEVCNETYPESYPVVFSTPAYNFFFVEVVELTPDYNFSHLNISIVVFLVVNWVIIWTCMIMERLRHGRMIWNNTPIWFIYVPWIWTAVLGINAIIQVHTGEDLPKVFRIDANEIMTAISNAFEIALYTHAASIGTELITGKGLNRYVLMGHAMLHNKYATSLVPPTSGHIDPLLNSENIWHSSSITLLTVMHSISGALCAIVDTQLNHTTNNAIRESNLWTLPMYSTCISTGSYSHFVSSIIFFGLTFSYLTVAYVFLKTALHTIFEYRVKLVFVEQRIVGGLILSCAALSLIFATSGGLPLLESIECIMTGVATHFICLMELVAMLYVYRSHDFASDVNVAMEDSLCSTRISYQWQCLPVLIIVTLILKIFILLHVEMPKKFMLLGLIPLVFVLLALPLRALHNTYSYLRPRNIARNN